MNLNSDNSLVDELGISPSRPEASCMEAGYDRAVNDCMDLIRRCFMETETKADFYLMISEEVNSLL